jgi:hypothetical protein
MIKHVVHIDRNYPRKFNGVDASNQSGVASNPDWSFDTEGDSLNGSVIDHPSDYAISQQTKDDSNPDQLFNDEIATETQYTNLGVDNQIRFNANVFNYIVHTSIENIVLKYDSPVFYGNEDWRENIVVLANAEYPIFFNILIHDPMGLDMLAYEAWVGGKKFSYCDRKGAIDAPIIRRENFGVPLGAGTIKLGAGNIIANGISFEKIDQFDESYAEPTSYRIKVLLSGSGYTADDINSTDDQLAAWENILEKENTTEEEIRTAWEACKGVKFKFFDVAGNITYWVMPYLNMTVVTLEDLYNMKKLILEFINTKPEDLQLGTDLIGRTTIKVTNPNMVLADYPIYIELDDKSIGQLMEKSFKQYLITSKIGNKTKNVASIATEDVDNIDESGWVIAHAYVDIDNFVTDATEKARIMVKNLLRATGSLGEWIKECKDNLRKINLDPFVTQYLKETTNKNNAYYKFVKFTENYLNTMYKAYDKKCYISILEVIHRIYNFNDPDLIYKNLLQKFDDDHGDMLHIDFDEMQTIIDTYRSEQEEQ